MSEPLLLLGQLESGNTAVLKKDFAYHNNVASADRLIRMGFLRKVYTILFTQLALTSLSVGVMITLDKNGLLALEKLTWLTFISFPLTIGFLIALMIYKHQTPTNYVLLFSFTICQAFMTGLTAAAYSATIVLQAFLLTTVVVLGLICYTMQSKHDFSHWQAGLYTCLFIMLFALPLNFIMGSPLFDAAVSIGGAVLFSMLIIFDTYRAMHHLSPEDYIVACIDLYLDTINLFLYMLRILQGGSGGHHSA